MSTGTRIGPYEIRDRIGVGGMGEVWRASDRNLEREVAIKVLPESFADDVDRLARFEREAKTLARLNHPNIATVHGFENAGGTRALVMELVEGPTLADRLANGPIPVHEALPIARQIADALEAAHEQGIIHRDLKPANVKVSDDGVVKVLDFGLAKALESGRTISSGPTDSPTLTSPAVMTGAGMLLGTASYMSPEQARGRALDKRTDIWSFGAVLYEMLTGTRAFPGEDVAETMASVLTREPEWAVLPAGLPPVLVAHLKRCLHKDRTQRIRDIGDVSLALQGLFEPPPSHAGEAFRTSAWRRPAVVVLAAIGVIAAAGLAAWALWPRAPSPSPTRFEHVLPEGQQLQITQRAVIAIAPDGRYFVYQARDGLYIRQMEALEARPIAGTGETLLSPFVSADGRWIGYFSSGGQLKKVAASGGTPVVLCAATAPFGASWSGDDTILFGQSIGIMRVSANGGTPDLVVRGDEGEQLYGPQLLPGGSAVLFSATRDQGPARWDLAQVVAQSLSSGQRTVLVERGSDARFLPTGHLVFALGDALFGAVFDVARLRVVGGAIPVVQGIERPVGVRAAASNYGVSDDGTLAYVPSSLSPRSLVWVQRNGTEEPIRSIPEGNYQDIRLSPDGGRVLATKDGDIWIYELGSGRSWPVTRDGSSLMAVWDPSGARVAYSSARSGHLEAWLSSSDGSGQPRQLTNLGGQVHVDSWSPDGRMLTLHHHVAEPPVNVLILAMDRSDAKPEVFFESPFNAEGGTFSRDQRYMAYVSGVTGQREIYVRPYPEAGGQVPVSIGGGQEPVMAKNGDLFYRSLLGDKMFAVTITTEPVLKAAAPVQVFQRTYYSSPTGSPRAQYDVTADGRRILMLTPGRHAGSASARPRVTVVQNWFEDLQRLLPVR